MKRPAVVLAVLACLSTAVALTQPGPAPSGAPAAPAAPAPPVAPPAPPPAPLAFNDAILRAANDLFSKATLPAGAGDKIALVIDPLIDGVTGAQSAASRHMGVRIADLVRSSYPRFEVRPFNTAEVAKAPVVLIGTFTPINNAGTAGGAKDAYRICLALADFGSRKIISKGVARAAFAGIDPTPAAFFADAPVFSKDPATESYIKSCQGTRPGDPIDAVYADRILAAALIADATDAYDGRHYRQALELYQGAARTPGGDQLRALNGIYLASWRLRNRKAAAEAFGRLVDYGLGTDRLAVKFLFRPGSTQFATDRRRPAPYGMWLREIASRGEKGTACLEVVGHTSPTGPAPLNDRLSTLRAEHVRDQLTYLVPTMGKRIIASGVGSKQNLIGTGRDDASDALDRRVEFKVIPTCTPPQRSAALGR